MGCGFWNFVVSYLPHTRIVIAPSNPFNSKFIINRNFDYDRRNPSDSLELGCARAILEKHKVGEFCPSQVCTMQKMQHVTFAFHFLFSTDGRKLLGVKVLMW